MTTAPAPTTLWRSLPGFLVPPVFADREQTDRARVFHWTALLTAAVVTGLLFTVGLVQPERMFPALRSIAVVDVLVLATLVINRTGRPRTASWLFLGVIIGLITFNALPAGGIRSPGVQSWFIFVMLAGLLLGRRAGVAVALVCVTLGLGLVLAEAADLLPVRTVTHNAWALWLLTSMYIGIALLTMRAATGRVEQALGRARFDLAQRKAAEARLVRALDAGQIGVFDHDLTTGVFRGDARALALTGLTAGPDGTTPFEDWFARVDADDRDRVAADLGMFAEGHPTGHTQYRYHHPDGTVRHLEAAAHLSLDEHGKPKSILGMIMDMTDRKEAAEEREQLLKDLGERVKELRLLHDAARLLQQASAIDRFLLTDLVERIPAAWLYEQDAAARIRYRDMVAQSAGWQETPWRQSARFTTSDGEGVIEVAYRRRHPDIDEGPFLAEERALIDSLAELLRTHVEQHAVQEQREGLEAQLRHAQKMDALGTLAGGIAHDFNNLLTAIGGNAQLAAVQATDGPVAEHVQEILKAHERARDLVKRILLFSRQQESAHRVIALPPVVDEVLTLLRASLPRNIEIVTSVAPDLPPVSADATQIHQVVMNLGTNAGYAMQDHGGTLRVTIDTVVVEDVASAPSADLEPGRHVRLTVRDTGTGMSAEVRDRLFEPFFTTKGQAGTGLGLAVVHGIIREHGGAITVESETGMGTAFAVYLPASEGATQQQAPASGIVRGHGQHIMYVDDEPSLALVMSRTLRHLDYTCSEFTDADAALHEFRTAPHAFDAVVTDLQMPTMSGLDLFRAVRAIRPDIPVAIASGYLAEKSQDPDTKQVAWIQKPSTLPELSALLQQMVGQG